MGRLAVYLFLGLTLSWTIPSSHAQRSIQQYLHLTGLPYSSVSIPGTTTANHVPSATQVTTSQQPRPATGLPSLSALSLPNLIAGLSQATEQQQPVDIKKPSASNIDGKLLNNLAIALQLLIVSNILNSPPSETSIDKPKEIAEPPQNQFYPTQNQLAPTQSQYAPTQSQYAPTQSQLAPTQNQYTPPQNLFFPTQPEQLVPGANFVGSSNFAEPNIAQAFKQTRNGVNLMSPYEALAKLSDPVATFTASSARKDFQSPYAMMDKDVFSMNDLF